MKKTLLILLAVSASFISCRFYETYNDCYLTIYNASHYPVWALCGDVGIYEPTGDTCFAMYEYPVLIEVGSHKEIEIVGGETWREIFDYTDSLILVFAKTEHELESWRKEKNANHHNIIIDTLLLEKMVLQKNDFDKKKWEKEIIYRGDPPITSSSIN